jgi:hypothetical protein
MSQAERKTLYSSASLYGGYKSETGGTKLAGRRLVVAPRGIPRLFGEQPQSGKSYLSGLPRSASAGDQTSTLLRQRSFNGWRSEHPTNDFHGIIIEAATVAEHYSLRLP